MLSISLKTSPKIVKSHLKKNIKDDGKISETFNNFFKKVVNTCNIEEDESILCDVGKETDPVKIAVKKYSKHPSILRIKQLIKNPTEFHFAPIDEDLLSQKQF